MNSRNAAQTREAGFTLVEMLVALAVFALLAAAGVGILRSSIDTQAAVGDRLTELGSVGRLHALLSRDLGQAIDRPTRAPEGQRPAFLGQGNGMHFVRAGWTDLDGAPRSDLQRVSWQFASQALTRTGYSRLDGADESGHAAPIARSIRAVGFRYRNADGSWSSQFESTEQQALPGAVELTFTGDSGEPIVMVVALPPGAVRAPPEGAAR